MPRFSPRPDTIDMPTTASTFVTSGTSRFKSSVARITTASVCGRVMPSGSSTEPKITPWSSCGRNDVLVPMNACTVKSTVSASNIPVSSNRAARNFAHRTKKPLKWSIAQLNHASGPCLYGRASWSKSEHSAGASVSAQTVEKHTAADSVTENCW